MSTAEAEYVSLSACCAQVIWMRTQLLDYGYKYNRILMYCDSKSTIAISCNPVQHSKTKHIDIWYHFIKEHVEKDTVKLYFVGIEYQLADLFTKALPKERFEYLVHRIESCLKSKEKSSSFLKEYHVTKNSWKELSFTLDDFRTIFHLPQATNNNHDSFVLPPSFPDMIPFYKNHLGFIMELKTPSSFKTTGLLQSWQTLCKIFSKCLTTRVTGWDQPPLQIMQMMYCFINNIHVDYAELLWEGIHYSLLHSTSSIPYPRFTKIIIGHYMTNFPEISRRARDKWMQQSQVLQHDQLQEQEAKENVVLVKEHLASVEIEKMVEGQENVVDDSSIPRNVEHNITRTREKGKNVKESRITPFPTPIRYPMIHTDLVSLDTEKLQELTFMPRKSFVTLANHLHEAMADSLPTMVNKHIKEQVQQQVPKQDNVQEQGPSTSINQEQVDDYDFWIDSYASDDDEIPTKQVSQDIMEEVSLNIDEMKNLLKSNIVWESQKEILVSPHPQKTIHLILSCQRDLEAPILSLINQDLLYLKKGNSGPEKIVLSLHKFPAVVFNDDDIEERTSRWIFYIRKQKKPRKPKEVIYLNSKIIQVIKTYWELDHEHKFITEIIARRANECIVSITEPDFKNLNKNDIKDMYLLIMNGKLRIESYQQKVNLTAPTISFLEIEKHEMLSIIYKPVHGIIYKNSKKNKRVMRHSEIHKFCDATLNRVLEGLKSYNNDVKYGYIQRDLTKDEVEYLKLFEEEIEDRLKYRRKMRIWESYAPFGVSDDMSGTYTSFLQGKALPLLSGSSWKEMHTDKAEPFSFYSFLGKQYTFPYLSQIPLLESGFGRSMSLPLSLVKLLEDFLREMEETLPVLEFGSLFSGLSLLTQSLEFGTISRSIGVNIPVQVIIYHRYRMYIMSRVGCYGLEHPQGRGPEHADDEIVAEDQPYAEDASPIAQSPEYADEEEEEHPAPADFVVVAPTAADQAPSAKETEAFETDESAATPPPHPAYRTTARISIPAPVHMPSWTDSEVVRLLVISSPPASPLSPWSSPPPAGGFRADYGFVATVDREIMRDPEREIGYGITDLWDEIVETLQGAPVSTDTELGGYVREFETRVRQDTNEIYMRLDDEQTERQLLAGRLNMLFRDRRAHVYTRHLMETEARMSREAWVRATDASDLVRGEVMSLHTTVLGQMSEIRKLQAADRRRQTMISELLRIDHRRSTEISKLRTTLQGQSPIQTPPVPQDEDKREPMFIQPHDPGYVPGPMYHEYIPLEDEHVLSAEEQTLPPVVSPSAESPDYVAESDPEEDPEEYEDEEYEDGLVDYPMDGGDDGDDDDGNSSGDDAGNEDEDKEEEEEKHLVSANSAIVIPTDELVSPPEGTGPIIPPPSTDITTTGARITVRLQAVISFPPEAEVERLLAMPTLSPSSLTSLSPPSAGERLTRCTVPAACPSPPPVPSPLLPSFGCLTQIQTLGLASTQTLIDVVTAAIPSPPLPPPLYIPPPVYRRDDIPEIEMPPRKRLCLSTLGSKYEIGESSTLGRPEIEG
uniref:Retrovirus-related Pol polyprotein from transposon TNT 1-94 n=1 Tax=Tanacetum cinerariifolium TaxID=118510 RepID=A0A6L2KHJ0_TANCI|nr:retrovirus-related Pol polyprotein from transposon TNT 1-94 [Tanacetum cinerariifolium]